MNLGIIITRSKQTKPGLWMVGVLLVFVID